MRWRALTTQKKARSRLTKVGLLRQRVIPVSEILGLAILLVGRCRDMGIRKADIHLIVDEVSAHLECGENVTQWIEGSFR
nr:hypothetical protein 5 [bacterium]